MAVAMPDPQRQAVLVQLVLGRVEIDRGQFGGFARRRGFEHRAADEAADQVRRHFELELDLLRLRHDLAISNLAISNSAISNSERL